MEIPKIILEQALARSNSSSIHLELKEVLRKLENKTLEEFINAENTKDIWAIDNEIRNIISGVIVDHLPDNEKINLFSQIIFTATEYLRNGILNSDIRSILIFLGVNCYLRIDISELLSDKELEKAQTQPASEKIITILKSVKIETYPMQDAPYHEKQIMNESLQGFSQNNIAKTYKMIEAIEHNGRGFHFNFIIENLISFLYQANFPCFINALSYLQNPTDFVFYFQSFKKEDLLQIAGQSSLSNKWLNFELIRQIIEKENKETIDESEVEAIKNMLDKIQFDDFDFLKQTAIYFNKSHLFNASLGVCLVSFSNAQMEEIIADFSINKYTFHISARDKLLNYYAKSASEEQLDLFLKLVFNKWRQYFDNILKTEDFYQNSILLTDFANYVVSYHTVKTDYQELISSMHNLIEKIKFLDSEWATLSSQQVTKFHLYHSELYLLTYAYKYKKLNNSKMLADYKSLIYDKIQLSRYVSDETKTFFEIGYQNIGTTKR